MKIALVWYFDKASWVYDNYRDGLRSAMDLIHKEHHVSWFLDKTIPKPEDGFDAIILWDDSNSEFFKEMDKFICKKAMVLTTNPHNFDNLRKLDVVFCESQVTYDETRAQGIRAIKAFGTDTDFFKPDPKVKKDILYFYPATFSPWKRQSEIAYLGENLLCVGTVQPDGLGELEACRIAGVRVEEGYYPVEHIKAYYNRTQSVIIPAVHGSERTVLECMSMNILPVITHKQENRKAQTYIDEYRASGEKTPRAFVLKNYSHTVYADKVLKGIS
jgi:hypothetical protein